MQTFDRNSLRLLRKELDNVLAQVGRENNISLKCGNIRFDSRTAKIVVEAGTIDDATGTVITQEMQQWRTGHTFYDLPAAGLGQMFFSGGTQYKITGLNTRRPKFPVSAERVCDGKLFKFPASVVRNALFKRVA